MRYLLAILLLCAWPAAAGEAADPSALAEIASQLAANPVVRAQFRQEKTISALDRPLVSEGEMIFVAGGGISWQIEQPYAVTILLTPTTMVERKSGGSERRYDMAANPFFRSLTRTFFAVMGGDVDSLHDQFVVETLPAEHGWDLHLTPKDPALARAISAIEVKGSRFVEEVRIREARGDGSRITFSGFRTTPPDPDEMERVGLGQ